MCVGCMEVVINPSARCVQSSVNKEIISPQVNVQAL